MAADLYSTALWRVARTRALARDGNRCTVSCLLGGRCSLSLHVHHIEPVSDGGDLYGLDNLATVCARHHPTWESLRRALLDERTGRTPRCRHAHRTPEAREICERNLARSRLRGVAALA